MNILSFFSKSNCNVDFLSSIKNNDGSVLSNDFIFIKTIKNSHIEFKNKETKKENQYERLFSQYPEARETKNINTIKYSAIPFDTVNSRDDGKRIENIYEDIDEHFYDEIKDNKEIEEHLYDEIEDNIYDEIEGDIYEGMDGDIYEGMEGDIYEGIDNKGIYK